MKTKPAHPLQAAGPIARAATPASAMRSVDAAFSGGRSARGKATPKREETRLFKIAAKGPIGRGGGVTASLAAIKAGLRVTALIAVTAKPAKSQGPGT